MDHMHPLYVAPNISTSATTSAAASNDSDTITDYYQYDSFF